MEAVPAMSELKRKREDVDEGKPDDDEAAAGTGTTDVAPAQVVLHPSSSSTSSPSSSSPQSTPPAPAPTPPAPCSTLEEGEIETHVSGAADTPSVDAVKVDKRAAKKVAVAERQTILICGKEVVLKSTGGRKRRKHPMETLVILAYKARLALECKANDMVAALEIYDEMKQKGVKRDLSVSYFLYLCFFHQKRGL